MHRDAILLFIVAILAGISTNLVAADRERDLWAIQLLVTSDLPNGNVPLDPHIDFKSIIEESGATGVLDPNSLSVINLTTGQVIPHALSEDFQHGDVGRVEWSVLDPQHKMFEIRYRIANRRPRLRPAKNTPLIGTGDLLRYNAGVPRPITPSYLSRLIDIDGDGQRDLLGCWNYAYRAGEPWDGIICFPRVGQKDRFEFGDFTRLRYRESADAPESKHFRSIYMHADFADFNRDGRIDVIYSPRQGNQLSIYLNDGRRESGGLPVFVAADNIPRPTGSWSPCRAVDLNGDDAIDIVVGNNYLRNTNKLSWPMKMARATQIDAGRDPCFFDIDKDGNLDAVCLVDGPDEEPRNRKVAWKRNLGGDPPQFSSAELLRDISPFWCSYLAAVPDGPRRGLLVQHDVFQRVSFYEQLADENGEPRFRSFGEAKSLSAVLALSDQAWPCLCDWDCDGDHDLLVGGGYGWPRIVINEGTKLRPAYAEAQYILSEGKPIRFLREEILGDEHWHNMGYPFPIFTDWDADGLSDLIFPNETNRIFWYKNLGSKQQPIFGQRQQILCDGYPDSPQSKLASAQLSADKIDAESTFSP